MVSEFALTYYYKTIIGQYDPQSFCASFIWGSFFVLPVGALQCSAQQALPYTPHSARIELLSQFKDRKGEFLKSPLSVRFPRSGPESAENERQEDWRSLVVARRVLRERARVRGAGPARGVAKRLGGARAGLHAQSVQDAVAARAHQQLWERDARQETRQHSHQLRRPEQRWGDAHHLSLRSIRFQVCTLDN